MDLLSFIKFEKFLMAKSFLYFNLNCCLIASLKLTLMIYINKKYRHYEKKQKKNPAVVHFNWKMSLAD